jgi:branched-chain amino acid transport system permease protein
MDELLVHFLNGISWGMVLFILASGLSLILGTMGILNLAHGALYMLGAYVGLTLVKLLGNFWLVAILSGLAVGVFGLLLERVFFSRLYKRINEQVLLTVGFVYILADVTLWVWGPFPKLGQAPSFLDTSVAIGSLSFPVYRFVIIAIGLAIAAVLWWFQDKTRVGAIVRAGMDDKQMTMGLGVNYGLISSAIFLLGVFLGGSTGFMAAPLWPVTHTMSWPIVLIALIVIVIGGVGNVQGTLLGATLIGVVDAFGKAFFPDFAMFTIYLFFIIVLLVKPTGLLGREMIRGEAPEPILVAETRGVPRVFKQAWQERLVSYAPYVVTSAVFVILPSFIGTYFRSMMVKVLILGIFAMSLNLIYGYTGLWSLGHAAYFGVGGYVAGILMLHYGIESFWLAAPAGILAATLVAAFFGFVALRVTQVYFVFVTMALGELLFNVAFRWQEMTGGSMGLMGIPYPELGLPWPSRNITFFYYLVLIIAVACMFLMYRIIKSPFGYALQGIRDDERRMQNLGYNTWLHKYIAFVVAGFFAGVAGVLFGHYSSILVPEHLGVSMSFVALLMIIIGSTCVVFGPVIGAVVVVFLEYFSTIYFRERWPLILGAVFVITIMFLRGGIGIHLSQLWNRLRCSYGSTKD